VDPLILRVTFCPGEAAATVVPAAAGVEPEDAVVVIPVGDAVATGVVDPLPVQPAKSIAKMSNAARLVITSNDELLFAFMVFDHPY